MLVFPIPPSPYLTVSIIHGSTFVNRLGASITFTNVSQFLSSPYFIATHHNLTYVTTGPVRRAVG